MVEGEGLDGEGGGPLVLSVADHRWAAVRGTRETTWMSTRRAAGMEKRWRSHTESKEENRLAFISYSIV